MRTGRWLCLIGLLVSPAAAGERPDPALLFNALWQRRALLTHAQYRLMVVELKDAAAVAKRTGTTKIPLRIVADVSKGAPTADAKAESVQVTLSQTHRLAPSTDSRYYLGFMRRLNVRNTPTWHLIQMYHFRTTDAQRRTRYSYYYLLPIASPDGLLARAIRELILQAGDGDEPHRRFRRMLAYVAGEAGSARDLASSFAAANGWGFAGADDQNRQPDEFARALLALDDAATRRRMAGAYSAAGADLLPRDPELLKRLFGHEDTDTLAPALRDNLRRAADRASELAGLIRAALAGTPNAARLRPLVLQGLTGWQDKALVFGGDLEAIVRGTATPAADHKDRLVALRVLLDGGADTAAKLVGDTLVELPSAVALEYAVQNDLDATVPAVLGAVGEGKLVWSEAHAAALSLLTGRFCDGDLDRFHQWWSGIQQAGRAEAMLQNSLMDAEEQARAQALIRQLSSPSYKQRRQARQQLGKMGMAILPALTEATSNADPDVAVAATALIASAEAKFKGCRDRLAAAAKKERSGSAFLPRPQDAPATAPAAAAGAKAAKAAG